VKIRPMGKTLILAALLGGCTTVSYQEGDATFSRTSFGTGLVVSKLSVTFDKDGKKTISLEGYSNDQVEALARVSEGIARGLASAIKP
jgi:hypothetical protein